MYCRNCGKQIFENAFACVGCGVPPGKGSNYCPKCGAKTDRLATACADCGASLVSLAYERVATQMERPGTKAILSMVFGIISVVLGLFSTLFSVVTFGLGAPCTVPILVFALGFAISAVALGSQEKKAIEAGRSSQKGRAFVLTGLITGWVTIALNILLVLILLVIGVGVLGAGLQNVSLLSSQRFDSGSPIPTWPTLWTAI